MKVEIKETLPNFKGAAIKSGVYKTRGYSAKEYQTLTGLKKGLKVMQYPFDFFDTERTWSYAGKQCRLTIY